MDYQHKVVQNSTQTIIYKFNEDAPYIPNVNDLMIFPEDWKAGVLFKVTNVDHYLLDKLIVINVDSAQP